MVNNLDGWPKLYKGQDKCEDWEFQNRNELETWKWTQTMHIFVSYANSHETVFTNEETPITRQKNQQTLSLQTPGPAQWFDINNGHEAISIDVILPVLIYLLLWLNFWPVSKQTMLSHSEDYAIVIMPYLHPWSCQVNCQYYCMNIA